MNLGGQRQHPRVQLDTAVRVRRGADGPWLNARALDLSEGGVRLQVHEGMPIGAEVRCSLPLLGARGSDLELLGTVAWVEGSEERPDTKTLVKLGNETEPAMPRRSLGLRFSPLPADDAERIRTAVRGAATRPCDVVLALEGRAEPVTARAEPTADGLLLRAPLPVVRPGAAVGVRFGEDGDSVVGVVKSVSLGSNDKGAPELRIELGGRDPGAPEANAEEQADRPSGSSGALMAPVEETAAEPAEPAEAAQPAPEEDPDDTIELFVPTAVPRRGASAGFVLACALGGVAVGIVFGLVLAGRLPLPSINEPKAQANPPPPVAAPTPPPAPAPAPPVTAPPPPVVAVPAVPPPAPVAAPAAPLPAPSAALAPVAVPPPAPAAAAVPAGPAPAAAAVPAGPAPAAAALPPDPAASQPAGQGLQVSTLGRVTRVRIPITGTGTGMRVYDLSSPGLTVNLPGADTPVRLGNFAVNTGLARRVWLRKLESGGLQVRVIYATRGAVKPEVGAENGALTIDLSL